MPLLSCRMRFHAVASVVVFWYLMVSPSTSVKLHQGEGTEPTASVATDQKFFDFRCGFWMNLHHLLYLQAVVDTPEARKGHAEDGARAAEGSPRMTSEQRAAWDKAVHFYMQYGTLDVLRDRDLIGINYELSDAGNTASLSGRKIPADLRAILEEVAPVYRALWWSADDRRNRDWIAAIAKLVQEHGAEITQRIGNIYSTPWPSEPVTAEVVNYANWAGAYTVTNGTLITISSTDPAGLGYAGLENIFHEASHAMVDNLQNQLNGDLRAVGKTPKFDYVHVIIFYTMGVVTAEALARDGVHDFTPYAIRNGLYERVQGWRHDKQVCDEDWLPYLNRKTTLQNALAKMSQDF